MTNLTPNASFCGSAFVSLTEDERKLVQQSAVPCRLKNGHIVFRAEDHAQYIYLIETGHVKIYRNSPWGKVVTVGIRKPGDLIGVCEVLAGMTRRGYAETLEASVLWSIDGQTFIEILQRHPPLAIKVANALGNRLREAETMAENLVSMEVDRRLARALIQLAEQQGIPANEESVRLNVPLTQQELAEIIGSCRQTVTTTLQKFRDTGFIHTGKRYIEIRDMKGLRSFVQN